MTGLPYRKASSRACRNAGSTINPHTHVALDDAIEQGALFCNMLAELRATGAGSESGRESRKDGDGSEGKKPLSNLQIR